MSFFAKNRVYPKRPLFVSDEEPMVEIDSQMPERLCYYVTCRTSRLEVPEPFNAELQAFCPVVTDKTMPQMTSDKSDQISNRHPAQR